MQGKTIGTAIMQGTITALIFLASWYALSQVNWTELLKVEDSDSYTEQTRAVAQNYSILHK